MRELTTEDFKREFIDFENAQRWNLTLEKPVMFDLWAPWCGPCKMTSPILEQLEEERDDIDIYKINVDDEPDMAELFQVQGIPTFILINRDGTIKPFAGALPREKFEEIIENEAM